MMPWLTRGGSSFVIERYVSDRTEFWALSKYREFFQWMLREVRWVKVLDSSSKQRNLEFFIDASGTDLQGRLTVVGG